MRSERSGFPARGDRREEVIILLFQ